MMSLDLTRRRGSESSFTIISNGLSLDRICLREGRGERREKGREQGRAKRKLGGKRIKEVQSVKKNDSLFLGFPKATPLHPPLSIILHHLFSFLSTVLFLFLSPFFFNSLLLRCHEVCWRLAVASSTERGERERRRRERALPSLCSAESLPRR